MSVAQERVAVVLAGGLGTRLHPYTMVIPKPLLPLGTMPILEILVRQLASSGFTKIILTIRYMAPIIRAMLGDGERFGLKITYKEEDEPLGTAGPLRELRDLSGQALVVNGDTLTDLDFDAFWCAHAESGAAASVVSVERTTSVDFGVIKFDDDLRMESYTEKPVLRHYVSTGIYMLSDDARALVESGKYDMPDLLRKVRGSGSNVNVHLHRGYWMDIGRFDDYQQASSDFEADPNRFLKATAGLVGAE